jgi:hypothetical protein
MKHSLAPYVVERLSQILSSLKRNSRSNAWPELQSLLKIVSPLALVNATVRAKMWRSGGQVAFTPFMHVQPKSPKSDDVALC